MKSKITNYILLVVLGVLLGYTLLLKNQKSDIFEKYEELKKEKQKYIQSKIDSILVKNKILLNSKTEKIDSLIRLKQKIKYVPYKKDLYVDRNLDDAIRILSDYTYQETDSTNKRNNNTRKAN